MSKFALIGPMLRNHFQFIIPLLKKKNAIYEFSGYFLNVNDCGTIISDEAVFVMIFITWNTKACVYNILGLFMGNVNK